MRVGAPATRLVLPVGKGSGIGGGCAEAGDRRQTHNIETYRQHLTEHGLVLRRPRNQPDERGVLHEPESTTLSPLRPPPEIRVPNKDDPKCCVLCRWEVRSSPVRKGQQRPWIVPDGLWQRIVPLLPYAIRVGLDAADWTTGRCCAGSCSCCTPASSGSSCPGVGVRVGHDLLAQVGRVEPAGVWQRLHELLLAELHGAGKLDWSRAVINSSHGPLGAAQRRPSPVDRARPGSKHHLLTEGAGIPLATSSTGGNTHEK
jgi:hypothetical protein